MSDKLYRLQFCFPLFNILQIYTSRMRLEDQGMPSEWGPHTISCAHEETMTTGKCTEMG